MYLMRVYHSVTKHADYFCAFARARARVRHPQIPTPSEYIIRLRESINFRQVGRYPSNPSPSCHECARMRLNRERPSEDNNIRLVPSKSVVQSQQPFTFARAPTRRRTEVQSKLHQYRSRVAPARGILCLASRHGPPPL